MSDEAPEETSSEEVDPTQKPAAPVQLGKKARHALIAKLSPLAYRGGKILDGMDADSDEGLSEVFDLTADDFLDPLWESVHGRSS